MLNLPEKARLFKYWITWSDLDSHVLISEKKQNFIPQRKKSVFEHSTSALHITMICHHNLLANYARMQQMLGVLWALSPYLIKSLLLIDFSDFLSDFLSFHCPSERFDFST